MYSTGFSPPSNLVIEGEMRKRGENPCFAVFTCNLLFFLAYLSYGENGVFICIKV